MIAKRWRVGSCWIAKQIQSIDQEHGNHARRSRRPGKYLINNCTVQGDITIGGLTIGQGVDIEDQGVPLANNPHLAINFAGAGVYFIDSGGGGATVTIPGGISGIDVQDEGVAIANNPHSTVNFVGDGVTTVDAGAGSRRSRSPAGSTSKTRAWRSRTTPTARSTSWATA